MPDNSDVSTLLALALKIVSAHVGKNSVATATLPDLIRSVYTALAGTGTAAPEVEKPAPFVPVKKSVFGEHLVCLNCGRFLKTLKRHLRTEHGLTPQTYREKWNLPASYPMVSPDYAVTRSKLAKVIGLGRKAPLPADVAPSPITRIPEVKRGRRSLLPEVGDRHPRRGSGREFRNRRSTPAARSPSGRTRGNYLRRSMRRTAKACRCSYIRPTITATQTGCAFPASRVFVEAIWGPCRAAKQQASEPHRHARNDG